jgi:hypothetical protein
MLRLSSFYEYCLFAADVISVGSDGLICKHLFSEQVTDSFKVGLNDNRLHLWLATSSSLQQ